MWDEIDAYSRARERVRVGPPLSEQSLSLAWAASYPVIDESSAMTSIGDSLFHKGQPIWVVQSDGSQRAAEYVGEGEMSAWFGGAPTVIVVYPDTHTGGAVEVDRVIARVG
jgi:hypothetical protein